MVGVLSIIGLLILAWPTIARQRIKAIQTRAVSNSRQLGLCLFEFESDYGKFPDPSTIAAVRARSGTLLSLGTKTSNDYFRQLLAAGLALNEQFFYANISGSRKPDGRMNPGQAIAKGECGYSYLLGLSSKGNPSRPIVVTPMIPGTDRFDPKPFDGKAVILKLDNSVSSLSNRQERPCHRRWKNTVRSDQPDLGRQAAGDRLAGALNKSSERRYLIDCFFLTSCQEHPAVAAGQDVRGK